LLGQLFERWVDAGRPGTDKSTPYPAFVARFESLVSPAAAPLVRRNGFTAPAPPEAFSNKAPNVDEIFGPLVKREASND
jgi:hypothetical protein